MKESGEDFDGARIEKMKKDFNELSTTDFLHQK